jgi:hypothetical protein
VRMQEGVLPIRQGLRIGVLKVTLGRSLSVSSTVDARLAANPRSDKGPGQDLAYARQLALSKVDVLKRDTARAFGSKPKQPEPPPVPIASRGSERIGFGGSAINVWLQDADCELFQGFPGADRTIGRSRAPDRA